MAILILRGNIRDGEVARVEVVNGKVAVIPNHADGVDDEDMMIDDDDDAVDEIAPDSMDEDIYNS